MDRNTDIALIAAARRGDKEAFGALADRYFVFIRTIALRLLGNQEIAQDLAQEAMLEAYLNLGSLREPAHFAPWLAGIARNLCCTWLRRQKELVYSLDALIDGGEYRTLPLLPLSQTLDPGELFAAREAAELVQGALATLSTKNQAAVWLFYYECLRIDEIAIALGVSTNVVKGRLYQARKQLQAQLGSRFERRPQPINSVLYRQERQATMTAIQTVHILKIEQTGHYMLYLLDTVGARFLRIWVGSQEGEQIHAYLYGGVSPRPMIYHQMVGLLQAFDIKLEEVRIATLKNNIFYAVAKFRNGDSLRELDTRPSDAIALALQTHSPILVDEQIMRQTGETLPTAFVATSWLPAEAQRVGAAYQQAVGWREKIVQESDRTFALPARLVLQQALRKANELNHNYVGTEHLLWGLVEVQDSLAARMLHEYQVTEAHVAEALIRLVGRGEMPADEPTIVPRVAAVLDLAVAASRQSHQTAVEAEHLLLAILRDGGGMAVKILGELGVDLSAMQRQLQGAAPI